MGMLGNHLIFVECTNSDPCREEEESNSMHRLNTCKDEVSIDMLNCITPKF